MTSGLPGKSFRLPRTAVKEPSKLELIINKRTAQALGLAIPADLLRRADEVIE